MPIVLNEGDYVQYHKVLKHYGYHPADGPLSSVYKHKDGHKVELGSAGLSSKSGYSNRTAVQATHRHGGNVAKWHKTFSDVHGLKKYLSHLHK